VLKSRFLLNNIRETSACNPGMFFSTCKALPLFDFGVHPEDLGIMVDKKLLNNSCKVEEMVQIPIKYDQISPCLSYYEIKEVDKIKCE